MQLVHAKTQGHLNCLLRASTALEEIYCHVSAKGEGSILPDMRDFRRNSADIQRLLLRRPAAKLGITLPLNAQLLPSASASPLAHKTASEPEVALQQQRSASNKPHPSDESRLQVTSAQFLSSCTLGETQISCQFGRFDLVNNEPNHRLAAAALSADNTLVFPDWRAGGRQSENEYLSRVYQIYIDKMLQIGLGAATMSYTRFNTIYNQFRPNHTQFAQRFASMFEYLKDDIKTKVPPKQLAQASPPGISSCDFLNSRLIVCDNGFNNWLYQKTH